MLCFAVSEVFAIELNQNLRKGLVETVRTKVKSIPMYKNCSHTLIGKHSVKRSSYSCA